MTKPACGAEWRLSEWLSIPRRSSPSFWGNPTVRLLSAVTRAELSFVIEDRKGETGRADLELLLRDGGFDIVSVTP